MQWRTEKASDENTITNSVVLLLVKGLRAL
jgi:hypothetical protein